MYFAPALEDLITRWRVPPRTAAAVFVAMANGAPDLASAGHMLKDGEHRALLIARSSAVAL